MGVAPPFNLPYGLPFPYLLTHYTRHRCDGGIILLVSLYPTLIAESCCCFYKTCQIIISTLHSSPFRIEISSQPPPEDETRFIYHLVSLQYNGYLPLNRLLIDTFNCQLCPVYLLPPSHLSSFLSLPGLPLVAFFSFAAQLAKNVSDTTNLRFVLQV